LDKTKSIHPSCSLLFVLFLFQLCTKSLTLFSRILANTSCRDCSHIILRHAESHFTFNSLCLTKSYLDMCTLFRVSYTPISCTREKLPSTRFGRYMGFAVLGRNSLIQLLAKCVLFPFIPLLCRMALVGVAD
jgi:hypothetical protein